MYFRLLVQNFWSSETRLPGHTVDRLVAMLEAMYSPNTEQFFLSYATNLVLEMTSKSPDYQREIFELPLEDCKFQVKSSYYDMLMGSPNHFQSIFKAFLKLKNVMSF